MSDPAAEPGAPTSEPSVGEAAPGSAIEEVKARAPTLARIARTPDRIILRLNKLLASPGGLSSFLSTFNYTLYLLAYLEAKSLPLRARLIEVLNSLLGTTLALSPATVAAPSHIAALGTLLSGARTTLRLFSLPPLYAWMRQLMQGPKSGQDPVLYATAVTQCSLYIIFQLFENVAVLTDHKVLAPTVTARWNKSGQTARIYLWSYRAWMGGVLCDFVRLFREAQLERSKRASKSEGEKEVSTTEEDKKADAKWWSELVIPLSWLPVALQFSKEGGIPGFNLGIMGACGAMAGLSRTAGLWAATADEA